MQRLIAFTLNRRITVLMMALAMGLVGFIAYVVLPLELLPSGFTNAPSLLSCAVMLTRTWLTTLPAASWTVPTGAPFSSRTRPAMTP